MDYYMPIEERIESLKKLREWKLQWRAWALKNNNTVRADRLLNEIRELDNRISSMQTRAAANKGGHTIR